jgi:hypothetical protein
MWRKDKIKIVCVDFCFLQVMVNLTTSLNIKRKGRSTRFTRCLTSTNDGGVWNPHTATIPATPTRLQ